MEDQKVQSGDVVKLKSGSPVMTAQFLTSAGVKCSWFVDHELKEGTFHPLSLDIIRKANPTS